VCLQFKYEVSVSFVVHVTFIDGMNSNFKGINSSMFFDRVEPHVLLFRRPRTDLGGPESKESEINVEQLPDPESEESEGSDESEMDSECLELSKSNNSKMELVEEIRQSWDS